MPKPSKKLGDKNREETVAQLELYLGDPAPFTVLVIEAARLDERMKLAKILAQKMLVVEVGLGRKPRAAAIGRSVNGAKLCKDAGPAI